MVSYRINLVFQRGCRKGDQIVPFLFTLCAQILSIFIKQNKEIKGVIINNKEYTVCGWHFTNPWWFGTVSFSCSWYFIIFYCVAPVQQKRNEQRLGHHTFHKISSHVYVEYFRPAFFFFFYIYTFSALCSVTQLRHSLDTDLRKKCHNAIGAQVSHRGYTLKYPAHCRLSPWYDTRIN